MQLPPLKEIINQCGLWPKKNLGQNFLLDLNLTEKIARAAGDIEKSEVLEIGPGPGGLTRSILNLNPIKLTTIERDARCIQALELLQKHYPGKLVTIFDDALTVKEEDYINGKVKLIANLPYNIATPLLFKWLDKLHLFESLTLMFQKEVADRIIASPKSKAYGRLSVMSQWLCEIKHNFDISPQAFYPPPKVTSSVITLVPRIKVIEANKDILEEVARVTFGQRRKTLKSSLKQITKQPDLLLDKAGIEASRRPEELTIAEFCLLARVYEEVKNERTS